MVGITGYGAYVPRLRLQRAAAAKANAWLAPNLMGKAKGERAMANWDEDAITMAVEAARDALFEQDWTVGAQSNRQGLRLHGRAVDTRGLPQLASEPVSVGTVQLPPAGEPVILLAEHQTTGGYPRILEVASAAEHLLAQAGAGCRVRFRRVGLDEADDLTRRRARELELRLAGVRQACAYPDERGFPTP